MNIRNTANETIDALHRLARSIDAEYSEDCIDASCTNPAPVNEAQRLVRQLHVTALELNASGLCDSGTFERFVDYASA